MDQKPKAPDAAGTIAGVLKQFLTVDQLEGLAKSPPSKQLEPNQLNKSLTKEQLEQLQHAGVKPKARSFDI